MTFGCGRLNDLFFYKPLPEDSEEAYLNVQPRLVRKLWALQGAQNADLCTYCPVARLSRAFRYEMLDDVHLISNTLDVVIGDPARARLTGIGVPCYISNRLPLLGPQLARMLCILAHVTKLRVHCFYSRCWLEHFDLGAAAPVLEDLTVEGEHWLC